METSEENNEDFTLLYSEELDAWILQVEEEKGEDENGKLKGIVMYVGDNKEKQEKEDDLLDLILRNDKNRAYYEEILRIINSDVV
tara:strand:+ start:2490 stop:2744 length:255 start_codon:yes stop_codon:yes gene_type:complete